MNAIELNRELTAEEAALVAYNRAFMAFVRDPTNASLLTQFDEAERNATDLIYWLWDEAVQAEEERLEEMEQKTRLKEQEQYLEEQGR